MRALLILPVSLTLALGAPAASGAQVGGDLSLTVMLSSNDGLRAQGMDYIIQQIDFFNRNGSRSSARLFQQDFRWVPGDPRRGASDAGLDYLVDEGWSDGEAGLDVQTLSSVVGRSVGTWNEDGCLDGAPLRRVKYPGRDVTVFDFLLGVGGFGGPLAADVVVAGLAPGMEAFFGPDTLAFSVTFVFVDGAGLPTDLDHDGSMDTALNEIYFNPDLAWSTGPAEDGFDLRTTALHELGHALGLGHFGSPPRSVMNPVYGGSLWDLQPIDHAALCLLRARE